MKVWIDQDLCTADGLCEEIAPDVFVMDSDGLTDGTFPPQPAKLGSLATGVRGLGRFVFAQRVARFLAADPGSIPAKCWVYPSRPDHQG